MVQMVDKVTEVVAVVKVGRISGRCARSVEKQAMPQLVATIDLITLIWALFTTKRPLDLQFKVAPQQIRPPVPNPNAFFASSSNYIASPKSVNDQAWYGDSGASTHVTNDLIQLYNQSLYAGNDRLTVGNGSDLHISHIGSIKSEYLYNLLRFTDTLCVPSVTKNLLSISKLTNDNHIFVEFHPNHCFIKDRHTKTILLKRES
ncbi:hypothetical protein Syun_014890 [Stephania yunnanensis]|uniref:Retrovirus-related Pol polyprotein from transposon TNT 1-94-like beta-barrel domain-containing protein n=1 Tax=Stephania yunnanensis TaxID=152371 RepID=A0AAP0JL18_9MAGN